MPNGDSKAADAFDLAMSQVAAGHPAEGREELSDIRTEELVRLHKQARVTNGLIESILIERLGPASSTMLLAAKG